MRSMKPEYLFFLAVDLEKYLKWKGFHHLCPLLDEDKISLHIFMIEAERISGIQLLAPVNH